MTGRLITDNWTEDLFFIDLIIGLAFGFLIYTLLHSTANKTRNIDSKVMLKKASKLLASFSFSLYLIHYPIINTVYYWGANNGFTGLQPSLLSVLIEIMLVLVMCMIAYLFSIITEARTNEIRTLMTKGINMFKNSKRNRIIAKKQNIGKY